MVTNGIHHPHAPRVLKPGIYAPMPTFFLPGSEDLDLDTFSAHVVRIARAGVGIVVAGSMGEAHHLTSAERCTLVAAARKALDSDGLSDVPIIAGTGLAGTRVTLELTREVAQAGADVAIVISAGYFAGAINKAAQLQLFTDVADGSPIPVMIYNFPGATGGIDIESDVIEALAQHPNICGVKLTCGNVGKLTRIAGAVYPPAAFAAAYPRTFAYPIPFLVLGGFTDFLVPSLFAHAHGAITGLANVAPRAIVRAFELGLQSGASMEEAQKMQGVIAEADRTIALAGIAGTKYLLQRAHGYGGTPRRPLLPTSPADGEALWAHPHVVALLALEAQCEGVSPLKSKVAPVVAPMTNGVALHA